MSVRAYILYNEIRTVEIVNREIDGETIECYKRTSYQSCKPLFNVWRHPLFFQVMTDFGYDYTNSDCLGEVYIDKTDWYDALDEIDDEMYQDMLLYDNEFGKEIMNTIDEWFKKHDYLMITCY